MLPARFRLRRRSDVLRVRQTGRPYRHPLLILLVCNSAAGGERSTVNKSEHLLPSRFAFLASRRVGNAVTRNRARRVLREAVRKKLAVVAPGWDCVVIAREPTATAAFADIESALVELFRRARILSPDNPGQAPSGKLAQ
jgi:ribonuclease P protein component